MGNDGRHEAVSVARGATYLYGEALLSNFVSIIYFAYASRILTQTEIGIVAGLSMLSSLLITIGVFSLPNAATRYIAEYLGKGQKSYSSQVMKKILSIGALSSLAFPAICIIGSTYLSPIFLGNASYQFLIILIAVDVFAATLSSFAIGSLSGVQKFKEIALTQAISDIARPVLTITLLNLGWRLTGVVIGLILSDSLGLVILLIFITRALRTLSVEEQLSHGDGVVTLLEMLRYSLPLYAADIFGYLSSQADKYVVLVLPGLAELGIYNVAIIAASAVSLASQSLSQTLMPKMAEQYGRLGEDGLRNASRTATRYLALIYIPMAIGCAAIADPILTLFAGSAYAVGSVSLAVILVASALSCLSLVTNGILFSLGSTRIIMESRIIGIVTEVLFSILFIVPPLSLGIVGAAIGRGALMVISFSYMVVRLRKIMSFEVDFGALKNAWIASAGMAAGVLLLQFFWMHNYLLPLYIIVGAAIYFAILRILHAVTHHDVELIEAFAPSYLRRLIRALGVFLA